MSKETLDGDMSAGVLVLSNSVSLRSFCAGSRLVVCRISCFSRSKADKQAEQVSRLCFRGCFETRCEECHAGRNLVRLLLLCFFGASAVREGEGVLCRYCNPFG